MTGGVIAAVAGALIQFFFAYFPKVKDWYEAQTGEMKGAVQLAALAVAAFGGFLPVCFGWFVDAIPLECTRYSAEQAVQSFLVALLTNQAAFLTMVKPRKARQEDEALQAEFDSLVE